MELKLRKRTLTLHKWKAKVKLDFINTFKNGEDVDNLQDVLVYNNINENIALSKEEFKYLLTQLRILSIGKDIDLEFYCEHCKNKFIETIDLEKIIKPVYKNDTTIKNKNYTIKIGEIKNPQYYKDIMKDSKNIFELDFFLRIESINGDDNFDLDSIIELFNNMDMDDYDDIFTKWDEIRFKIDDTEVIKCKSCETETKYSFDEIPGFFPSNWFKV